MEPEAVRVPDSLYNLGISAVIDSYHCFKNELRILPDNLMFDLYYKLYKEKRLCLLGAEFSDLNVFCRVLNVTSRRMLLLRSFQALMDHGTQVAKELASTYVKKCSVSLSYSTSRDAAIELGLRLGGFLSDAGWFAESEKVLLACQDLCHCTEPSVKYWRKLLECYHKLLHTQAAYFQFDGAKVTYRRAVQLVDKLRAANEGTNFAGLFAEFSVLHFIRSDYDEAYIWGIEALKQLRPGLPSCVVIDVLRQVAKSCVVKREFKRAEFLAKQAVCLTKEVFDKNHLKYSDSLLDFGFFLLNFDSIRQSVSVYETALDIREAVFGKFNLHVAVAHEELAYALYVHEYSSGRFHKARDHAEKAIVIMEKLLPKEHLMLASVKRVKALILEEIALDSVPNSSVPGIKDLLLEAESLHMSALKLAITTFGEENVQTAKHFGNLGRLYQSMKKFQEAETMHLKAIAIKEQLLGVEDYEVGLSLGHLASLYNYHMKKYKKAEQLYLRSIAISLKLFGGSYSGLEYDYRGLVHVYHGLEDVEKVAEYTYLLNNWKLHRDLHDEQEDPLTDHEEAPCAVDDITRQFFNGI